MAENISGRSDSVGQPFALRSRISSYSDSGESDPTVAKQILATRDTGDFLPESTRRFFEPRFGADFNSVRVHTDSRADGLNRAMNSRAFTAGSNIFFSKGEYDPHGEGGRKLLAHELTHVIHQSGNSEPGRARTPFIGPTAVIQKKDSALAHATGEGEWIQYVAVSGRTVEGWRTFLKEADEEPAALQLNVFLALATRHTDYIQTGDEPYTINPPIEIEPPYQVIRSADRPQRQPVVTTLRAVRRVRLSEVAPPSAAECTNLMVALLTTPDIDLREVGDLSPALGYLLPQFIKTYYEPAMQYVSQKAGEVGGAKNWAITTGPIDDFLGQAEGAFSDTRELEEQRTCGYVCDKTGQVDIEPSKLYEIGVSGTKAGEGPTTMLQAMAMAGAQGAALSALAAALDPGNKETGATIAERADREIAQHARVLSGVVKREKRIEALNEVIIKIVANAVLAASGMGLAQAVFEKVLARVATTFVVECLKQGVTTQAGALAGLSADQLAANFRSSFALTIQEHLNKIRAELNEIPAKVGVVADSVKLAFLYEST